MEFRVLNIWAMVKQMSSIFYVLLTVHLDIILVNNQLDAQLFSIYGYFDTLNV